MKIGANNVQADLSTMRSSLYAGHLDVAREAKDRVELELRRVMVRTERLASTPNRDGMIGERDMAGVDLTSQDVRDYKRLSRIGKELKSHDLLEYWRSSPYVLELMDGYKVKKDLQQANVRDADLIAALGPSPAALRWDQVNGYKALDPGNAKMRGLMDDVITRGSWKLAWIPPALPYYELSGAYADESLATFTKRLVFSSWNIVPKAIGTLLSYEAERRLAGLGNAAARSYDAPRQTGLLSFQRTAGRLTGMPVLGMLFPSVVLAKVGDPLTVARECDDTLPMSRTRLESEVSRRIARLLETLPAGHQDGPPDGNWYWAAAILLDRQAGYLDSRTLVDHHMFGFVEDPTESTETRFHEHAQRADDFDPSELGRRPQDLLSVLTRLAIAAPGVTALRALSRVSGGAESLVDFDVRNFASCVAWALRNLFNRPEMMALVRGQQSTDEAYWQDVLQHCMDGGLQPVLDEYAHVLNESLGVATKPTADRVERIAAEIDAALSLRTSVNTFTELRVDNGRIDLPTHRTRTHFAVRFGRGVTEDSSAVQREGQVRIAYNSPFWPFVLASTSVGQEGLDFHQYSHAIVHWNLPSNPVDLEQREGRVHRYKGHAVRKNVARVYGSQPEVLDSSDPWAAVFSMAADDRPEGETEVFPYWIFPVAGGAQIERFVPMLPFSKETHGYRRLMRTVGAYRLVVGQPRQEDLLRYLGDRVNDMEHLRIDLTPNVMAQNPSSGSGELPPRNKTVTDELRSDAARPSATP